MAIKGLLIKNNKYDGVRAVIQASQSSIYNYYYTEAQGDRYYFTITGSTASKSMESASFESYLAFTMSGATTYDFTLIPMSPGETCFIETKASCANSSSSKGYIVDTFGGFRHTGSTLPIIGSTINYTTKTDFTTVGITFSASGTQSINMKVTGQTSEVLDWDVYIKYTKMFHTLTSTPGGGGGGVIYPVPPER